MINELVFLIVQCVLSILVSYLGIFQLRKEYRKKTQIAKEEARQSKKQFILIALFTIILQVLAFINSQKNNSNLQNRFTNLSNQNTELKNKIAKSEYSVSSKIDSSEGELALQASKNALKASADIKYSTNVLSSFVNGSNLPPRFAGVNASNKPSYVLENRDSLKEFIDAFTVNYDEVLLCKRSQGRVDRNCFKSYLLPITWMYILPGKQVPLELPNYNPENKKSKFFISVTLSQSKYIIEVVILKIGTETPFISSRTLKKGKEKYSVYHVDKSSIKIDWDNEFILPYDEKWGDLY